MLNVTAKLTEMEKIVPAKVSPHGNVVQYQFGDFLLIPSQNKLWRGTDELPLSGQRCRILTLLAEHAPQPVSSDALRQLVWNGQQRSPNAISQAIYDLRKFLGDEDQTIIRTDEERGYYLGVPVRSSVLPKDTAPQPISGPQEAQNAAQIKASDPQSNADRQQFKGRFPSLLYLSTGLVLGSFITASLLLFPPIRKWVVEVLGTNSGPGKIPIYAPEEEEAIQHVVRYSQLFMTLQAYRDPTHIDKAKLEEYLVPKSTESYTVNKIIDRFKTQNLRYGDESRNEGFEVTSVTVFSPGDTAEATTLEGWYVPAYKNGQRDTSRKAILGPYRLLYQLRKLEKKWRIERSTTPVHKE